MRSYIWLFLVGWIAAITVHAESSTDFPPNSEETCAVSFPPVGEAAQGHRAQILQQLQSRARRVVDFMASHDIREGAVQRGAYESLLWDLEYRLRADGLSPSDAIQVLRTLPLEARVEILADWVKPLASPAAGPGALSYNRRLNFGRCLSRLFSEIELQTFYAYGSVVPCGSASKYENLYALMRSDLPAFQSIANAARTQEVERSLQIREMPGPRVVRICHWVNPAFAAGGDCHMRRSCDEGDEALSACGLQVIRLNAPTLDTVRGLSRLRLPEGTVVFVDSHGGPSETGVSLPQYSGARLESAQLLEALPPTRWNVWLDACHAGRCTSAPANIGFGAACRADQYSSFAGPFERAIEQLLCRSTALAAEAWSTVGSRPSLSTNNLEAYLSRAVGRQSLPPHAPEYAVSNGRECHVQNPVLGGFEIPARLYGPRPPLIDSEKLREYVLRGAH